MLNKRRAVFEFGNFRLDPGQARLTRDGVPLVLAPKAFSLLLLLVERAGQLVEKEELLKSIWPDSVVEEANLTVHISALRKALAGAGTEGGSPIETISKRGYRFTAPVTLIEPEQPPTPSPPFPPTHRKRWPPAWVLIAAAAVAAGLSAAAISRWRTPSPLAAEAAPPSIVVLPFQLISAPGADDRYLSLGLAEALINRLAMLAKFNVRPITQVIEFDKPGQDSAAVARKLMVDWVLTGTVQHLDKRLRVTAQLMRARDGKTVWAEKYDELFTNIFALQDDLAEKLALTLVPQLSGQEQRALTRRFTENPEVFRLNAEARMESRRYTPEGDKRARDLFEQAIALDPEYPMTYAGLVNVLVGMVSEEPTQRLRELYTARVRECLAAMRRLNPELPELYLASAMVEEFIERDWAAAESDYRRALAVNPNLFEARAFYARLLLILGRLPEAEKEYRRAVELNPAGGASIRLAAVIYHQGRYAEALELARLAQGENASPLYNRTVMDQVALALVKLGRFEEAIQEIRSWSESADPALLTLRARIHALAGRKGESRELIRRAVAAGSKEWPALAAAALASGDREPAMRFLAAGVDRPERSSALTMKSDIDLAPLRSDPRFQALLERLNLR